MAGNPCPEKRLRRSFEAAAAVRKGDVRNSNVSHSPLTERISSLAGDSGDGQRNQSSRKAVSVAHRTHLRNVRERRESELTRIGKSGAPVEQWLPAFRHN